MTANSLWVGKESDNHKYAKLLQTEEGFEEVFLFYYSRLKSYALTILFEDETANDIVQDVFLNLWNKRKKLPPTLSLSSYLYKAVYNSCLNHIKHQKANLNFIKYKTNEQEIQTLFFENNPPPQQNIDVIKMQDAIQQTIHNLPEQTKRIFLLSRKFNMKNREIADFLDVSVKAVEKHVSRALKELRDIVTQKFPDIF